MTVDEVYKFKKSVSIGVFEKNSYSNLPLWVSRPAVVVSGYELEDGGVTVVHNEC
jgi:hypothetical protein